MKYSQINETPAQILQRQFENNGIQSPSDSGPSSQQISERQNMIAQPKLVEPKKMVSKIPRLASAIKMQQSPRRTVPIPNSY